MHLNRSKSSRTGTESRAIIHTTFMSGVRLNRHYLRRMKKVGWGRLLFIFSESAVQIPAEMIRYSVTKIMQIALARGLAETTAGTGVTGNSYSLDLRARNTWSNL
jgi:NAD(P)-dependent dehydrogenase (short-subunit alcohol dehydrogenase family)